MSLISCNLSSDPCESRGSDIKVMPFVLCAFWTLPKPGALQNNITIKKLFCARLSFPIPLHNDEQQQRAVYSARAAVNITVYQNLTRLT